MSGGLTDAAALQLRAFERDDTESVVALWHACGLVVPWNDPHRDIERKLAEQPELFLVGERDGRVVASVMIGYDGHRGWMNYLAVDPAEQGRGHGRALVREAERMLTARGCPKLNLQVRGTNTAALGFYEAIGYAPDNAVSLGKRLIADD
ncbi:GNAT family acetyltransferase [Leifsonia sp. Leaf264]|uniref:GNAT family acetyltransferase n=1 Tax=Leifsonia sp. Leaf264 TaxID=1736314 RepID=UPI000A59DCFC|nr:GNAT family acetyltransferase [Leifsonia sp. Leaf264]